MNDAKPFLTVADVAQHMGRSEARIYQLLARGELPYTRVGGRLLIPSAAWERWLEKKNAEALAATR